MVKVKEEHEIVADIVNKIIPILTEAKEAYHVHAALLFLLSDMIENTENPTQAFVLTVEKLASICDVEVGVISLIDKNKPRSH